MSDTSSDICEMVRQSQAGEFFLFNQLLAQHRGRLRRSVELRMHRLMRVRVDPSDVVQEAYVDATRRLDEFLAKPAVPFFVWLRGITLQKLAQLHRYHLRTHARNAHCEVPLDSLFGAGDSSQPECPLAESGTGPGEAAIRAQHRDQLADALQQLDAIDRDVLWMRHFEELSNGEVASVLDLTPAAASMRYRRALSRLRERMLALPGDAEEFLS